MQDNRLIEWVKDNYQLEGKVGVELLRSYTNEVYLIKTLSQQFILKLYHKIWRSKSEVLWEIDLVNHLSQKNVGVVNVIKGNDGKSLKVFNPDSEDLLAVMFEYAKGNKPQPPFTPEIQYKVGKASGSLHKASDDFSSPHQRPSLDLKYLIDDSILVAREVIFDKEELKQYEELCLSLKAKINSFIEKGLDWGPVHGDLTLDNLHIDEDGEITFYDFDSAGFGWRAMELYGWVALNPDKKVNVEAYLKGYQEVRPINYINIEASPYLQAASDMWLREGMKALSDPEILKGQLTKVKAWEKYFQDNKLL